MTKPDKNDFPYFLERVRGIDFASDPGIRFQAYIEPIARRLIPDYPFDAKPLRFILSDDDEINAEFMPDLEPRAFYFTRGMIDFCQSEDDLAYMLSHELVHHGLDRELGPHKNSKGEEFIGDGRPVPMMYDAGYQAAAALPLLERVRAWTDPSEWMMRLVSGDPHGLDYNRLETVAKTMAVHGERVGGYAGRSTRPIPDEMIKTIRQARHVSHCDRWAADHAFASRAATEQLALVRDEIPQQDPYYPWRAADLGQLVRQIQPNRDDEGQSELIDEIDFRLRQNPAAFRAMYGPVNAALHGNPEKAPVGIFADMNEWIGQIVEGTSPIAARRAGADLMETHRAIEAGKLDLSVIDFARFELLPERFHHPGGFRERIPPEGLPLAWDQPVRWAAEDAMMDDARLLEALWAIGVRDPRLIDTAPVETLRKIAAEYELSEIIEGKKPEEKELLAQIVPPEESPWTSYALTEHCEFDFSAGCIVKVDQELGWVIAEYAAQTMKLKASAPNPYEPVGRRQYLDQVPDAEFVANFPRFYDTYLMPWAIEPAIIQGPRESQATQWANYSAFVLRSNHLAERFDRMLQTDSAAYGPFIREFFANQSPQQRNYKRWLDRWFGESDYSNFSTFAVRLNENALLRFVLRHPHPLFTPAEKRQILEDIYVHLNADRVTPLEKFIGPHNTEKLRLRPLLSANNLFLLRETLSLPEPENNTQILASLRRYDELRGKENELIPKAMWLEVEDYLNRNGPGDVDLTPLLVRHPQAVIDCFERGAPANRDEEIADRKRQNQLRERRYSKLEVAARRGDLTAAEQEELRLLNEEDWFDEKVFDMERDPRYYWIAHVEKGVRLPKKFDDAATIYLALDRAQMFPSEEWRGKFAEHLLLGVAAAKNPRQRVARCERLLFAASGQDHLLRKSCLDAWLAANLELYGLDEDDSPAYRHKLGPLLDRVKKQPNFALRHDMLSRLAETLQTQRETSYAFRDAAAQKITRAGLEKSQNFIAAGEAILAVATSSRANRDATFDFLMAQPVEEEQRKFVEMLEDNQRTLGDYLRGVEAMLDATSEQIFSAAQLNVMARRFHDNFWNAPPYARVPFMDELLLPPGEDKYLGAEAKRNFDRAFAQVAGQIFPDHMQYGRQARQILEIYCDIIPVEQRSLVLSTLLVAGERARAEGETFSIGQRLALAIGLKGPAERKFGQRAHSLIVQRMRDDPDLEKLAADLRETKTMSGKPPLWEWFERFDDTVPESYARGFVHFGEMRGAASFYVSMQAKRNDGTHGILAILRENAKAQATNGYDILRELGRRLGEKTDSNLVAVAEVIVDAIDETAAMVDIETSGESGAKQAAIAARHYNGLSFTVGGERFDIRAARWFAYGPEFRYQEEMPGVPFNELPQETEEQKRFNRRFAKGYMAVELAIRSTGEEEDIDRHGGQLHVEEHSAGLFDHGAMSLEPPTAAEKASFARVLGAGIAAATQSATDESVSIAERFTACLHDEIARIKTETGQKPHYLMRIQQSELNKGDFNHRLEPDDFIDILKSVYQFGRIDPIILQTLMTMAMNGEIDLGHLGVLMAPPKEPIVLEQISLPPPPEPLAFTEADVPQRRKSTDFFTQFIEGRNGKSNGKNGGAKKFQPSSRVSLAYRAMIAPAEWMPSHLLTRRQL